jgi:outer membrane protein assembly factor BamB
MAESCSEHWRITLSEQVGALAVSDDGQRVFVGTLQGSISCLSAEGVEQWRAFAGGPVRALALAPAAGLLLVGRLDEARLFDFDGHQQATLPQCGSAVAITPDAERLFAAARHERICGFNRAGEQLWAQDAGGDIAHLTLAPDGEHVGYVNSRGMIELRDREGRRRMFYRLRSLATQPLAILPRSAGMAAFTNDRQLHAVAADGSLRWQQTLAARAETLAVAAAGDELAVGTSDGTISLLESSGALLWQHKTSGSPRGLALAANGRFLAGSAQRYGLFLIDCEYEQIWRRPSLGEIKALALSPDGRWLVVATADSTTALFENSAARDPARSVAWRERRLVRQLRSKATLHPLLGLANWLDTFDQALRANEPVRCGALLDEIRRPTYQLSSAQQAMVDSREAALQLRRGLDLQAEGDNTAARAAFAQSLALHERLGHREGEGQALAALHSLDLPLAETAQLRVTLHRMPLVLGSSDAMIADSLPELPHAEQLQIISAATLVGSMQALLRGVAFAGHHLQTAAAGGLATLDPGPDLPVLAKLLASTHWFVRWQAVCALGRKTTIQPWWQNAQIRHALLALVERGEPEPLLRRELARTLGLSQDPQVEQLLLPWLQDPDDEVRLAVVDALAACGTRRALAALTAVPKGSTLSGRDPQAAAAEAQQAIQRRSPIPSVQAIWLRQRRLEQTRAVHRQQLFLPGSGSLEAVIALDQQSIGVELRYCLSHEQRLVGEQTLIISSEQYEVVVPANEPLAEDAPQQSVLDDIQAGLVELLDGQVARQTHPQQPRQLCLPLEPPDTLWAPGNYTLEIWIEEQRRSTTSFRVAAGATIEAITLQVGSVDRALIMSAHEAELAAIITLDTVPMDTEVRVQLQMVGARQALAEAHARTSTEGHQQLRLELGTARLFVGGSLVVAKVADTIAGVTVQFDRRSTIEQLVMCKQADAEFLPLQATSTYSASEPFVCVVETGPVDKGTRFEAVWRRTGQALTEPYSFRAQVDGPQRIAFSLRPGSMGWQPGEYDVVIQGPGEVCAVRHFAVRANGFQQLITVLRRSGRRANQAAPVAEVAGRAGETHFRIERLDPAEVRWLESPTTATDQRPADEKALNLLLQPAAPDSEQSARGSVRTKRGPASLVPADVMAQLAEQFGSQPSSPARSHSPTPTPQTESDLIRDLGTMFERRQQAADEAAPPE